MNSYREVVALFHSEENLEEAIHALTTSGWNRSDLSLLAQHHLLVSDDVSEKTQRIADEEAADRQAPVSESDVRQGRTLVTGMSALAAAFIASGATIMTGGGTLAAIVGATVAGGGAGALVETLGSRVGSQREHFLQEQIEKGGIVLWVKVENAQEEQEAKEILGRCRATDIHIHEMSEAHKAE